MIETAKRFVRIDFEFEVRPGDLHAMAIPDMIYMVLKSNGFLEEHKLHHLFARVTPHVEELDDPTWVDPSKRGKKVRT